MKTQKVNIDEVARRIPSLFESTGENEFQVDTEQFGIVTVTIGLQNDEVFFEARDQTGTLVPTKYLDGYVGPWNLVVNEFRRFRPKGMNRGEGKSPFGLEITPAESTSPLWIPNRSRLELKVRNSRLSVRVFLRLKNLPAFFVLSTMENSKHDLRSFTSTTWRP